MLKKLIVFFCCILGLLLLTAFVGVDRNDMDSARDTGVSALWILANISFAGMRAQNSPSTGWRIIAFIFGFPGTLLSLICVKEGSERAYGVEISKRRI